MGILKTTSVAAFSIRPAQTRHTGCQPRDPADFGGSLIDPERWKQEKRHLLDRADLAELVVDPAPVLAALGDALDEQCRRTNANAVANAHLKARADGTFHVATRLPDPMRKARLASCFRRAPTN